MSVIYPFKPVGSRQQHPAPRPYKVRHHRPSDRDISDSQALQELIDILKQPFQTRCDKCRGTGVLAGSEKPCEHCNGTGKVLMDLL